MRRQALATLALLAATTALSACVYDAAKPMVFYDNNSAETVVVEVEGADRPTDMTLESGTTAGSGANDCLGTAIVVHTQDGTLVGRVDEPACPFWKLVINADGTLDYQELDH